MSAHALGPQFHATLAEHADRIVAQGFQVGGPSGYGSPEPVHNHGAGVYTASRFAIENTWAGTITSSPYHARDVRLKTLEVEYPKDAKVHVINEDHWFTAGGTRRPREEGVQRHLAQHPDVAAHYEAPKGLTTGHEDITAAARKAGYDAVHIDRGSASSETVWFDPSKLRARG